MEYIAHIKKEPDETFRIQTLEDHLAGTSFLAERFAAKFNNPEWGRLIGLWHDLGKYSDEFQNYIRINSGFEEGERLGKSDHSSAAAILAKELYPIQFLPIAYCIAGHHAGLHNMLPDRGISGDLTERLRKKECLEKIRSKIPGEKLIKGTLNHPCGKKMHPDAISLWIRMLFSCLVDADFLDTERFMNPEYSSLRNRYDSIAEMKKQFDKHMDSMLAHSSHNHVNNLRKEILDQSIQSGNLEPGFFSMTVPTGGGKTLSSMAWALTHALRYNKMRIIYAIPYTSIIIQTATIFRAIFGEKNVVEHHSNIDESIESQERKLATENWDAPIILTTNVQLFESLYSNRTVDCRKLHNIVNSIIILDEAQMLPPEFLKPVIRVLKGLVEDFSASILFSTATQPAFAGKVGGNGQNAFTGLEKALVREIVNDPESLVENFKRVEIEIPRNFNEITEWHLLAEELMRYDQVLCIVNTRKQCRELSDHMPEDTIHLSRLMCNAHILESIELIKNRLREEKPIRVISTQLIEAGVDIDFPVVYRAIAGLDSIVQSSGRCNREGKLNKISKLGLVKLFVPPGGTPIGLMRKGADTFKELVVTREKKSLLDPEAFFDYFRLFYSKIDSFDKPDIEGLLIKDAVRMKFQFATASREFRLIDDKNSKTILVGYKGGNELIELFKRKGPEPWLMRKLQRYAVSVNERDFNEIRDAGLIIELYGCWIQNYQQLYNQHSGLQLNGKWLEEINII